MKNILTSTQIETPFGLMIAIADEEALLLLEFMQRKNLASEIRKLEKNALIIAGRSAPLNSIEQELVQYFKGELKNFTTPIKMLGTDFQKSVWQALQTILYGETRSYAKLAQFIDRPHAYRAVARANSTNQLAIIVPCHRVINSSGKLGGYAGGIERKAQLLAHELQV